MLDALFHRLRAAVVHLVVVPYGPPPLPQQQAERLDLITRCRLSMAQEEVPASWSIQRSRAGYRTIRRGLAKDAGDHCLGLIFVAAIRDGVDVEHVLKLAAGELSPGLSIIEVALSARLILEHRDEWSIVLLLPAQLFLHELAV